MLQNSLSFLTPLANISNKQLVLEKKYSQFLTLKDGETITLASDIGIKDNQEDSLAIAQKEDIKLLLVADGMGGMSSGEVASYNVAKSILEWFESESIAKIKSLNKTNLNNELVRIILFALMSIPHNSGTTLNMSIILPKNTLIVNVGDSRTYTIKDGKITLQTKDDSLAFAISNPQTSQDRDKLRFYRQNHIITEAITPISFPKLTISSVQNDEYDIICHITDGVSDILSESEIEECCQSPHPANTLVGKSIYQKDIHGTYHQEDDTYCEFIHPGKDNATAIVYTKKRMKNN